MVNYDLYLTYRALFDHFPFYGKEQQDSGGSRGFPMGRLPSVNSMIALF
jgi:hypothetical protein